MADKSVTFETSSGTRVTCGLELARRLGYSEPKSTPKQSSSSRKSSK